MPSRSAPEMSVPLSDFSQAHVQYYDLGFPVFPLQCRALLDRDRGCSLTSAGTRLRTPPTPSACLRQVTSALKQPAKPVQGPWQRCLTELDQPYLAGCAVVIVNASLYQRLGFQEIPEPAAAVSARAGGSSPKKACQSIMKRLLLSGVQAPRLLKIILLHRSGCGVDLPEYRLRCTFRGQRFLELGNLAGKPRVGEHKRGLVQYDVFRIWMPQLLRRQAAHHPQIWALKAADPKSGLWQQTSAQGLQNEAFVSSKGVRSVCRML